MPITKIAFIRATLLAILVGLGTLLIIVGVNLWLVHETSVYSDRLTVARAERYAIVDLRNLLDDAETGQRGYLLTGSQDYLSPYTDAERRIPDQVAQVRRLFDADPAQKQDAAKLTSLINDKLAELHATIALFQAGKPDQALAELRTNRGKQFMDGARVLFRSMQQRAEDSINNAVRDQEASITALQWVTIGGALVILVVVGGSAWTIVLYTRQLIAAQREVALLNVGLEARVRERTADLGRANDEIQRFAYIVTHDLRAPLVNIMGFTSELESALTAIQAYVRQPEAANDGETAKNARTAALDELPEAIGFIRSSTAKMDGLINAILKLSREGRRVLRPEPIKLDALLKSAADTVAHQVAESGGAVNIDAKMATVVSDRLALEQIFGNLLDNAVKYREAGRPLQIHIRAHEDRGQRIIVEVRDNGRGIAKQDHERVFDLFRRSGAQDRPGEGIGLAHVRTMVRNLGGDITLQSEIGQGTTMKLNLPRDLRFAMTPPTGAA